MECNIEDLIFIVVDVYVHKVKGSEQPVGFPTSCSDKVAGECPCQATES